MFVFPKQCGPAYLSKNKEKQMQTDKKVREREGEKKTTRENRKENIECKQKHYELRLSPVPHRESGAKFHCREHRHIPKAGKKR